MVGNLTLLSVFHLIARWKLNFPLRGSSLWGGVLWFSRKNVSSLPCWFSFAPSRGWVFGRSSKTGQLKSTTVCADSTFSTIEKVKTFFTASEKSGKCYSTAECVFPSFQAEIWVTRSPVVFSLTLWKGEIKKISCFEMLWCFAQISNGFAWITAMFLLFLHNTFESW